MESILMYLLFIVGIVLIVKGGDWFVDGAVWVAEVTKIPKFIIGATIVSLATTLPEIIVSTIAAVEGHRSRKLYGGITGQGRNGDRKRNRFRGLQHGNDTCAERHFHAHRNKAQRIRAEIHAACRSGNGTFRFLVQRILYRCGSDCPTSYLHIIYYRKYTLRKKSAVGK